MTQTNHDEKGWDEKRGEKREGRNEKEADEGEVEKGGACRGRKGWEEGERVGRKKQLLPTLPHK